MKKLLLLFVMIFAFALTFTLVVSADSVHNENTVDYSETVTLSDETVLPLFDGNKDALIWYIDGKDENGNNVYNSILTEDQQVKWYTETWNEVTGVGITFEDGTKVENKNIVVVNLMDDDVVKNHGPGTQHYGKHITGFKYVFRGWTNLEYVYLRLDTGGFYKESFNNCSKLQYVNLEDLTRIERIGDSYNFAGCKSLFKGQVLDLSKTKLWSIDWNNSFTDVPMIGIKLPSTMTRLGDSFKNTALISFTLPEKITVLNSNMFYNCVDLATVTLSSGLTGVIAKNAFYGCTSLNTVYYVGTLDELTALLDRTEEGNDAFLAVAGENRENLISYADYQKLEDKSGKYMVYNYSWCEAYNDGVHEDVTYTNDCVGVCNVCNNTIVNHVEGNTSVVVEYASYTVAGTKSTVCDNEGCGYKNEEMLLPLFASQGYSVQEKGGSGISIGYGVNLKAIEEYKKLTGKEISYGFFAVLQDKLGENEIMNQDGSFAEGVINADYTVKSFDIIEFKISGYTTEEQMKTKIAMGVYAYVKDEKTAEISYLQTGTPSEGAKYSFVSYRDLVPAE